MAFRRGFKSDANWYARELRRELKIPLVDPLCPWRLARHLGFPIVPVSAYAEIEPSIVAYFRSGAGQKDFSAITLFDGTKRLIVHNDSHDRKRQAADIAHELAHGLLLHPPKPPINSDGSRHYDENLEAEANWLGPALLVSDEAAVHIIETKMSIPNASDHYGASVPLVRMRINVSGAALRVTRRRVA